MEIGSYPVTSKDVVSDTAITEIYSTIKASFNGDWQNNLQGTVKAIESLALEWITKRGTFAKRLARALKTNGVAISNDVLSKCGKIARDSCTSEKQMTLKITQDFDWQPGTYGDGGSCYWGCRAGAKDMILNADGGALLLHGLDDRPLGRCWYVPQEDNYVLFNAYQANGLSINLTTFARIVADLTGHTYYRKIKLENNGTTDGKLWINSGAGFVVGPQKEIQDTESIDLNLEDCEERCSCCGDFTDGDGIEINGETYCDECAHDNFIECDRCGDYVDRDSYYCFEDGDNCYCEDCWNKVSFCCDCCERDNHIDYRNEANDQNICDDCLSEYYFWCETCREYRLRDDKKELDGEDVCDVCFDNEYSFTCESCGDDFSKGQRNEFGDVCYCDECYSSTICECDACNEECDYIWVDGMRLCPDCHDRYILARQHQEEIGEIAA